MEFEKEIRQQQFKSEFHKASLNLIFTSGWLINQHKEFFKPYGITPQQYNVLRILRGSFPKSISTSDIKERMMDKNSDASRIVSRITSKGWASKEISNTDRRLVDVIISQKGLDLLSEMDENMKQVESSLGGLSKEDAKKLNTLLDKVRSS